MILLAAPLALVATAQGAAALVEDLAEFKKIPVPQGVACNDDTEERTCEFKATVDGKEHTFFTAFLQKAEGGEKRKAFAIGAMPCGAAKMPAMETLYRHYASVLALNETEAVISAIPSLAALPELCAKSPSARRTGEECMLAAGESVVHATPGDDDQHRVPSGSGRTSRPVDHATAPSWRNAAYAPCAQ
jgi:hypothetical protein